MTRQKSFKDKVRTRMDKTGESYTTARRQLVEKAEAEARKKRTPRTISPVRKSEEAVKEKTGRTWDDWFKALDKWGGKTKKHSEIARWLTDEHGVDGWWAQSVTVAYEQARGMRAPGQRADGTYSVSASKTINVNVEEAFDAMDSASQRRKWLGDSGFKVTKVNHSSVMNQPKSKTIRASWQDGPTRLTIWLNPKGEDKTQVGVAHERITEPQQADELKAFWRDRLDQLKKLLKG